MTSGNYSDQCGDSAYYSVMNSNSGTPSTAVSVSSRKSSGKNYERGSARVKNNRLVKYQENPWEIIMYT